MNNQLYFGINGQPLEKNNLSNINNNKRVIHRKPVMRKVNDTPSLKNVVNNNKINSPTLIPGLSCNLYCVPLLILVLIVSVCIISSLCLDVFKNKKMTLNILWGVLVNIVVVVVYFILCQKCQNNNVVVKVLVNDLLPWVVYLLLIGVILLYISNRVITK